MYGTTSIAYSLLDYLSLQCDVQRIKNTFWAGSVEGTTTMAMAALT
jgi:hypothetical protein